jgi:TolB-like protein
VSRALLPALALIAAAALSCATLRPYRFAGHTNDRQALANIGTGPVAVLPFSGPDGNFLADFLTDEMERQKRFEIVNRNYVAELYRVQELDEDRVDQVKAAHLGRMLGARAVLLGTISDYRPGRISASARLVAVETGTVVWQGSDALSAADPRVQSLVQGRDDRNKLRTSPDYLCQWFCRLLAESMK